MIWSSHDHDCLIIFLFLYLYIFPKKSKSNILFLNFYLLSTISFNSYADDRDFSKWHCFHNLEQSLKLKDTLAIFCSPGLSSVFYFWGIAVCKGICQSNSKHGLFPSENPRIIFNCKCFYFQSLKIPLSLEVYLKIALWGSLKSLEYDKEEERYRMRLFSATDNNV